MRIYDVFVGHSKYDCNMLVKARDEEEAKRKALETAEVSVHAQEVKNLKWWMRDHEIEGIEPEWNDHGVWVFDEGT